MDTGTYITLPQKKIMKIEAGRKELIRGLSLFLLVAVVFLFLRLILKLFGANSETIFTGFVYIISGIFLLPFFGIFPHAPDTSSGPSADVTALMAIFSYIILFLLAMVVIHVGAIMLKTKRQVDETVQKSHPLDTSIVNESVD